MTKHPPVYPLLWSMDVAGILDWATRVLRLTEVWRDPSDGSAVEHGELAFAGGRISVNIKRASDSEMGASGIALHLESREAVDASHAHAVAEGARFTQGADAPEESFVSYGFTALDPDGNQWWVHRETGALDALRAND